MVGSGQRLHFVGTNRIFVGNEKCIIGLGRLGLTRLSGRHRACSAPGGLCRGPGVGKKGAARVPRRRKRRKCRPRPVGAGIADGPQSRRRRAAEPGQTSRPQRPEGRARPAPQCQRERVRATRIGREAVHESPRAPTFPHTRCRVYRRQGTRRDSGSSPGPARRGSGEPRRQARRGGIAGVAGARAVLAVARWCAGTKPPSMECRRRKCGAPAMRARESSAGGPIRARRRGCRRRPFRRGAAGASRGGWPVRRSPRS